MSGAPRLRSINVADSEVRPVLGPAGNKTRSVVARKPASKPLRSKVEKTPEVVPAVEEKKAPSSPFSASSPPLRSILVPSTLRKQDQLLQSNLSLDASCSSDASSDSLQSRSSAGRVSRSSSTTRRRQPCVSKPEKAVTECVLPSPDSLQEKKRCAWVTPNTEPCYVAFHDEEWGIPVHDDRKLFELLVLSGALAEITWPTILIKRHIFREVFADFDPVVVSKLNEKKLTAAGSTASSLLSELKLRSIIENARQISKIVDEFGSFDKYIWSFVNHKPIVSKFRYPRQIPTRTAKAEVISKDLLRRGFRSVSPTIIYSFMQVAGMTNDHLVSCFRFQECVDMAEGIQEDRSKTIAEEKKADNMMDLALARAIDELSISSESSSIHGKKEDGF